MSVLEPIPSGETLPTAILRSNGLRLEQHQLSTSLGISRLSAAPPFRFRRRDRIIVVPRAGGSLSASASTVTARSSCCRCRTKAGHCAG